MNVGTTVDQVFPGFEGIFKDLFSKNSMNLLELCLSPHGVIEREDESWAAVIKESTKTYRS